MDASAPLLLLADAHDDCREVLAMALELCGYRVEAFRTGDAVLRRLREATPAAVVLDAQLPGVPGAEVARVMRANPRLDSVRILVTATWLPPQERKQMASAGVDAVWMKPAAFDELVQQLSASLSTVPPPRAR